LVDRLSQKAQGSSKLKLAMQNTRHSCFFLLISLLTPIGKIVKNELPAAELRGIRCHAGLDKPAPAIPKPGASSLDFWIPTIRQAARLELADMSHGPERPVTKANFHNLHRRTFAGLKKNFHPD